MSSKETAYRTSDPDVVETFITYKKAVEALRLERNALAEEVGRPLMAQRITFGRGTRIVGFAPNEGDKTGDPVGEGLTVSSKRGPNKGIVVPDRHGAGRTMALRLSKLDSPEVGLPGMPDQHIFTDNDGMRSGAPALWISEGVVYALWPCDSAPVEENWEQIPLSTYHLASEQHQAALDAREIQVSGNEDSDDGQ